MGGGKIYNMIVLGFLVKYLEFRKKVLGDDYLYMYIGRIRFVVFIGWWINFILWVEIVN